MASSSRCAATPRRLLAALAFVVLLASAEAYGAQLTASWVDNSNGVATTRVERRKGTEPTFTPVADVTPGGTSYVDASVSSGTTYCYRLLAYDATTVSPYSNEACGTTSTDGSALSVTISKTGDGTGLVTSTPAGISCAPTCAATFASTTVVTLAATPNSGSTFSGWSGGGCAGTSTCTLVGNTPVAVTASFAAASTSTPSLLLSRRADRSSPGPLAGATVAQDIFVFLSPVAASRVRFFVDDPSMSRVPFQTELSAPFDLAGGSVDVATPFDTRRIADGPHTVTAAIDLSTGGTAVASASFAVANGVASSPPPTSPPPTETTTDTTAPVVALALPSATTLARRSSVTLTATASDNVGVAKVEFWVNGSKLCDDTANPYTCVWRIPAAANKTWVLQATATDGAGNVGRSSPISVTPE